MAITVTEKHGSGQLADNYDAPTAELEYIIEGTDSESDAIAALEATAPGTYWGLRIMGVTVEPMEGNGFWLGKCSYGRYEWSYQFDTTGGTKHIIASKSTSHAYGTGATTDDNGGLIGVTGDAVEGCDITIPVYSFSETHYKTTAEVTQDYKMILFNLTGTTNNALFKGFQIGEVLFMGASGSKRSNADYEITYHFQASKNLALGVGGIMVTKMGWEYMWVRYKQTPIGGLKMMGQKPVAVYTEKVYDAGDFSTLGIGT